MYRPTEAGLIRHRVTTRKWCIVNSTNTTYRRSFPHSLTSGATLGVLLTGGLHAMMFTGVLNNPLLLRYCLSHWTATASLTMFFIAIAFLAIKLWTALAQLRLTSVTVNALNSLIHEGHDTLPADRPRWLEASWLSLPVAWQYSWFGMRLNRILSLQLKRGRRDALEQDLRSLSKADSHRQHGSYSPVRMIICAIPILGILGTAIIISELGPRNEQLKSGASQTPAGSTIALTAPATAPPAFVSRATITPVTTPSIAALDTAVLALALTLVTMFAQLVVTGTERDLLERIDQGIQDTLIEFLAADPHDAEQSLFAPVKQMTSDLVTTIHQVVEQQANIWSRSISESQRQWSNWTQVASECITSNLTETIAEALKNHASRLERIQEEGSRQIDTRWQQWQTTLSDQARAMSSQQKELIRQTDSIQQLVLATTDLRKLEDAILESVSRLENIHRLEDASQCVGEAVAVLATSLERAGIIRGAPVRPRVVRKPEATEDEEQQRKSA